MPFDRGTITCRICHLQQPLPDDLLERFAKKAAGSLDNVRDEAQIGWVSGRHLLETRIDDETAYLGGHLHLCLRIAQRKVPASLLRAECRMIELNQMAETKSPIINRKEKKRIKEEVAQRLLPQMPPQLSGIYFALDAAAKRLYVGAASDKQFDLFLDFFEQTVGFEPLPLTPEVAAADLFQQDPEAIPPMNISPDLTDDKASGTIGQNFLTWLWYLHEDTGGSLPKTQLGEFSFMIDGPLAFIADGPGALEIAIRKGLPTLSAEAKAALMVGKKLKRAKLVLARSRTEVWNVMLDADTFLLRGLKLPEGEALESHAAFEERLTYMHIFQTVLYALYQRFLVEFADSAKTAAYLKKAKQWVKNRDAK